MYTHASQVWFSSIDGSMLLYLTTAVSRIVLGVSSVGADHTYVGITTLRTGACTVSGNGMNEFMKGFLNNPLEMKGFI